MWALSKDTQLKGTFYYNKKGSLSMVYDTSKEMLLAVGNDFTMVKNGRKRTVKAQANGVNPYKVMSEVFAMVYAGSTDAALKSVAEVTYGRQSGNCTITATPRPANGKQAKRAMYSKFVATVNMKTGEVSRIVIYDKSGSHMQYDFSSYAYDTKLAADVFTPKFVKKK